MGIKVTTTSEAGFKLDYDSEFWWLIFEEGTRIQPLKLNAPEYLAEYKKGPCKMIPEFEIKDIKLGGFANIATDELGNITYHTCISFLLEGNISLTVGVSVPKYLNEFVFSNFDYVETYFWRDPSICNCYLNWALLSGYEFSVYAEHFAGINYERLLRIISIALSPVDPKKLGHYNIRYLLIDKNLMVSLHDDGTIQASPISDEKWRRVIDPNEIQTIWDDTVIAMSTKPESLAGGRLAINYYQLTILQNAIMNNPTLIPESLKRRIHVPDKPF